MGDCPAVVTPSSPLFPTLPHSSPLFPTLPHSSPLFPTLPHTPGARDESPSLHHHSRIAVLTRMSGRFPRSLRPST
ncbi:MAG: hypothetical protein EKK33_18000 [Bradyrhizobiaceae bacterium]|nr:MAG: hypothetical protein EKK33_18000 [Bradyrhizobiaceae bacterium]